MPPCKELVAPPVLQLTSRGMHNLTVLEYSMQPLLYCTKNRQTKQAVTIFCHVYEVSTCPRCTLLLSLCQHVNTYTHTPVFATWNLTQHVMNYDG